MRSVMAQGTGRDKMAALTIMVQEKPVFNISALQSLIGLVKPGKKECPNCIGNRSSSHCERIFNPTLHL